MSADRNLHVVTFYSKHAVARLTVTEGCCGTRKFVHRGGGLPEEKSSILFESVERCMKWLSEEINRLLWYHHSETYKIFQFSNGFEWYEFTEAFNILTVGSIDIPQGAMACIASLEDVFRNSDAIVFASTNQMKILRVFQ